MKTQVVVIGGGPAGLLLARLLMQNGIATVLLERRSRAHVLSRIRAGVLEWGSVETLRRAGVGTRMDGEGEIHHGVALGHTNHQFRIDFAERAGRAVMVYGQTEITKDLYTAHDAAGSTIIDNAEDVTLHDVTGRPRVTWHKDGRSHEIEADFVAGCDGFHGVSRQTIPADARTEYERVFPFGWLGILSETPPVSHELIYSNHARGFALASMRNPHLSRYYVQVPADDTVEGWSDERFWDELRRRLPHDAAEAIVTGPSIEKSIALLRSFVCEPMRWGNLFLAGDAAHIVPPTGAKGLNLAIGDVALLAELMSAHFAGDTAALATYSDRALERVWAAIRFSVSLTGLLHRFPGQSAFEQRLQEAELAQIERSDSAQTTFARNYTGLLT
ncbi:4-hydroxybenzoate 3-monooxygenase [Acuticoccus sp. I52.16.1]|uniref:4-hydroxybenzoate 3-monooxygenase n=1 Tax=Acuticoccus sp. I52.16.1 TaxID=2928472 RepID=UPI001FD1B1D0|nr:4-hydroxybenzoate 3-monooxygenase [Acuticoccus sp. I52.16.1]UOM35508.1 4-hydroxybenzoate 3-monooxygenase [Acuticoccus sp. I52.16.1]